MFAEMPTTLTVSAQKSTFCHLFFIPLCMSIRRLGVLSLVLITIGSVDSIRNLPATALFGSNIIAFFVLAALFFLIPSGLISAELASESHEGEGGIYRWVAEALGEKWGFMAIWFQWIENVVYYPALLSFIAGTVAYLFAPDLVHSQAFLIGFILIAFWLTTILNLFGMKASSFFANICSFFGLVLPMAVIIIMGAVWVFSGKPLHVDMHPKALLPDFSHPTLWVTLTGVMLSMCGIEIATIHVRETKNPKKTFPRALGISVAFILITLVLGALSIAVVVPAHQLSLIAGIMQAFEVFFTTYHLHWIMPLIGVALIVGGMGGLNNWLIAPTRGLHYAGTRGHFPQCLLKENKHGAPVTLLIIQALIVTVTLIAFILLPSINASYWYLNVLAAQLYMMMYVLMFIAGIVAKRRRLKNGKAGYAIPGGMWGTTIAAVMGVVGSVATILIGFVPPDNIHAGSVGHYALMIAIGLFIMSLPAFFFMKVRA